MLFAATGAGFGFVYLLAPVRWVQVALVVPFLVRTATINPGCFGLPELLDSPSLNAVGGMVRAEPDAQWVVYDSLFGVELIKACGAHLINGVRVVPDAGIIRGLDPGGKDAFTFNRYSHLFFLSNNTAAAPVARLTDRVACVVQISPPQLLAAFPGVRFIAVPHPLPALDALGFRLVGSFPVNRLWVYRRK